MRKFERSERVLCGGGGEGVKEEAWEGGLFGGLARGARSVADVGESEVVRGLPLYSAAEEAAEESGGVGVVAPAPSLGVVGLRRAVGSVFPRPSGLVRGGRCEVECDAVDGGVPKGGLSRKVENSGKLSSVQPQPTSTQPSPSQPIPRAPAAPFGYLRDAMVVQGKEEKEVLQLVAESMKLSGMRVFEGADANDDEDESDVDRCMLRGIAEKDANGVVLGNACEVVVRMWSVWDGCALPTSSTVSSSRKGGVIVEVAREEGDRVVFGEVVESILTTLSSSTPTPLHPSTFSTTLPTPVEKVEEKEEEKEEKEEKEEGSDDVDGEKVEAAASSSSPLSPLVDMLQSVYCDEQSRGASMVHGLLLSVKDRGERRKERELLEEMLRKGGVVECLSELVKKEDTHASVVAPSLVALAEALHLSHLHSLAFPDSVRTTFLNTSATLARILQATELAAHHHSARLQSQFLLAAFATCSAIHTLVASTHAYTPTPSLLHSLKAASHCHDAALQHTASKALAVLCH